MFSARGDFVECKELAQVSDDSMQSLVKLFQTYMILIRGSSSSVCNKIVSTAAACVYTS